MKKMLVLILSAAMLSACTTAKTTGDLTVEAAQTFIGTPYVAHTLDINPTEQLVVTMDGFDCQTLVETSLAMARTVHEGDMTAEKFKINLENIRYRNGVRDGYASRLHYATDWLYNNEQKGILKDVTPKLDGKPATVHVNYMSTHPADYAMLKDSPTDVEKMKQIENIINARMYRYIPKEEIAGQEKNMENGDVVIFMTSKPGLDASHMGVVSKADGKTTFIHASSKAGKVIVNPASIADYCSGISACTGIVVGRAE